MTRHRYTFIAFVAKAWFLLGHYTVGIDKLLYMLVMDMPFRIDVNWNLYIKVIASKLNSINLKNIFGAPN